MPLVYDHDGSSRIKGGSGECVAIKILAAQCEKYRALRECSGVCGNSTRCKRVRLSYGNVRAEDFRDLLGG